MTLKDQRYVQRFALTTAVAWLPFLCACPATTVKFQAGRLDQGVLDVSKFSCHGEAKALPQSLQRLSGLQVKNSIQDILSSLLNPSDAQKVLSKPEISDALNSLPEDVAQPFRRADSDYSFGFLNGAVNGFAFNLASALSSDETILRQLSGGCQGFIDSNVCLSSFFDSFGARVLRRPLSMNERQSLLQSAQSFSGSEKYEYLISYLLASPDFLLLPEVGTSPASNGEVALSGYELASRISYLYWDSVPDEELFSMARSGEILTTEGQRKAVDYAIESQSSRTRKSMQNFTTEWLGLDAVPDPNGTAKNAAFMTASQGLNIGRPGYNHRDEAREEIVDLVDDVMFDQNGSFEDLFTTRSTNIKGHALAEIYGQPVGTRVLPVGERAGLLTRPAFLLSSSPVANPIHRAKTLRERLLCDTFISPQAAGVPASALIVPAPDGTLTTRERYAKHIGDKSSCMQCHVRLNDFGFGLQNYDSFGRFRDTETIFDPMSGNELSRLPIDPSVVPRIDISDPTRANDAIQLSEMVARSPRAEGCFVTMAFRYSLRREIAANQDGCHLQMMRDALEGKSSGSLKEMFKSFAIHPSFRFRRIQ